MPWPWKKWWSEHLRSNDATNCRAFLFTAPALRPPLSHIGLDQQEFKQELNSNSESKNNVDKREQSLVGPSHSPRVLNADPNAFINEHPLLERFHPSKIPWQQPHASTFKRTWHTPPRRVHGPKDFNPSNPSPRVPPITIVRPSLNPKQKQQRIMLNDRPELARVKGKFRRDKAPRWRDGVVGCYQWFVYS